MKQIYLEAARRIAEGERDFTCTAVHAASGGQPSDSEMAVYSTPAVIAYLEAFAPEADGGCKQSPDDRLLFAIQDAVEDLAWPYKDDYRRHLRVMLLCMMAAAS